MCFQDQSRILLFGERSHQTSPCMTLREKTLAQNIVERESFCSFLPYNILAIINQIC